MKSVIACFEDKRHLEKVEAFCSEEKLSCVINDMDADFSDSSCVFVITDIEKLYNDLSEKCIPVCFISDKKFNLKKALVGESFSKKHLRMVMDAFYHGYQSRNFPKSLKLGKFSKEYILENDYYNIDKITYSITSELAIVMTFADLEKLRVGISEMLTNAIEHGNLGITANEKMESTENGTYYELLESRSKDKKYAKRRAKILMSYDGVSLKFVITDDGKGFNTANIPDPRTNDSLLKLHGRGIFITRMYFNQVSYNDKGNVVTLIKTL